MAAVLHFETSSRIMGGSKDPTGHVGYRRE